MKKMFLLLLAVIFVAGCTQPVTPGPPGPNPNTNETAQFKEVSMMIGHTFYNPVTITVERGQTLVIKAVAAQGTGSHNHGITIDEYSINEAVTTEAASNPVIIRFNANKPGTFNIYCKTCWDGPFGRGHPDIKATLIVNP